MPSAAAGTVKQCPVCKKRVEVTLLGTFKRHSPVWEHPPPGAPVCVNSGAQA